MDNVDPDPAHLRPELQQAIAAVGEVGRRYTWGDLSHRPRDVAVAAVRRTVAHLDERDQALVLGTLMGKAQAGQTRWAQIPGEVEKQELLAGLYEAAGGDVDTGDAVEARLLADAKQRGHW